MDQAAIDKMMEKVPNTPCVPGGTNVRSHTLKVDRPDYLEYRASSIMTWILLPFALGGTAGFCSGVYQLFCGSASNGFFFIIWGAIFGGIPFCILLSGKAKPAIFNGELEAFYCDKRNLREVAAPEQLKDYTKFSEIVALQLLQEYCSGNKSSYYSYELNLVCKDGHRVNVFDTGSIKALRRDTQKIAAFLKNPPIYDAIEPHRK